MKTLLSTFVAFTIAASTVMAATSYDTLTRDEKSAYRLGECHAIWNHAAKEAKEGYDFIRL